MGEIAQFGGGLCVVYVVVKGWGSGVSLRIMSVGWSAEVVPLIFG